MKIRELRNSVERWWHRTLHMLHNNQSHYENLCFIFRSTTKLYSIWPVNGKIADEKHRNIHSVPSPRPEVTANHVSAIHTLPTNFSLQTDYSKWLNWLVVNIGSNQCKDAFGIHLRLDQATTLSNYSVAISFEMPWQISIAFHQVDSARWWNPISG